MGGTVHIKHASAHIGTDTVCRCLVLCVDACFIIGSFSRDHASAGNVKHTSAKIGNCSK